MKFCLILALPTAMAFAPQQQLQSQSHLSSIHNTCLRASRRDCLNWASLSAAAVTLAAFTGPQAANAELDYERIQDLLKDAPQGQEYAPANAPTPGARPKWLTEPTEDFKENERKSSDFKRQQLKIKAQAQKILDQLQDEPNSEDAIAGDLDALRRLVRSNGGLPLGITKDDVVKQVRRKKAKKYWPTNVEIAYQDLLAEIAYQTSPNNIDQMGDKKYL